MPKTEIDLRLDYKRETGEFPPSLSKISYDYDNDEERKVQTFWLNSIKEYIDWLENNLVTLKNK